MKAAIPHAPPVVLQAMKAGAVEFLVKPLERDTLQVMELGRDLISSRSAHFSL